MNLLGVEIGYEDRGDVNLCELDHKQEFEYYSETIIGFCEWIIIEEEIKLNELSSETIS